MLDSHGILLTLLWLIAAGGIIVFTRWLNRFLATFEQLETEMRLLIMIGFVGVVLFGTLNFLWDSGRRSPNDSPTPQTTLTAISEEELNALLQNQYPSLHESRNALLQRINALQNFFQDLKQWAKASPHQTDFLQALLDIHWKSQESLVNARNQVERSIQEFTLHYSTGKTDHVINTYRHQADELVKTIQAAQRFDSTGFRTEQTETQNLLKKALAQLGQAEIPPDPKNRKQPITVSPYDEKNRQLLLEWLQLHPENQPIIASIETLQNNQKETLIKQQHIIAFLDKAQDRPLHEAMKSVLIMWEAMVRHNQYADYQILFAVESLYLLEKLTPYQPPNASPNPITQEYAQTLYARLLTAAPEIAQRAYEHRVNGVERSYNPSSFIPANTKQAR